MKDRLLRNELLIKQSKREVIGECVLTLLIIIMLFTIVAKTYWLLPVQVIGHSMDCTLDDGDLLLIDKFSNYEVGDVVVIKIDENTNYIKRIIAVGGQRIFNDKNGYLYIEENGIVTKLDEPYAYFSELKGFGTFDSNSMEGLFDYKVTDGHIFVLGDNRWNSKDSRKLGFFSEDAILGIVPNWVINYKEDLEWLYRLI